MMARRFALGLMAMVICGAGCGATPDAAAPLQPASVAPREEADAASAVRSTASTIQRGLLGDVVEAQGASQAAMTDDAPYQLASFAPGEAAPTGGGVHGRNYRMVLGEYPGNDLAYWKGPFSACAQACDNAAPACVAYTLHKDNGANCWLKSKLEKPVANGARSTFIADKP